MLSLTLSYDPSARGVGRTKCVGAEFSHDTRGGYVDALSIRWISDAPSRHRSSSRFCTSRSRLLTITGMYRGKGLPVLNDVQLHFEVGDLLLQFGVVRLQLGQNAGGSLTAHGLLGVPLDQGVPQCPLVLQLMQVAPQSGHFVNGRHDRTVRVGGVQTNLRCRNRSAISWQ